MSKIKRVLIALVVILVFIIIFSLGKYFYKYYVITKFQRTIEDIRDSRNYQLVFGDFCIIVKDEMYVKKDHNGSYVIIDNYGGNITTLLVDGCDEFYGDYNTDIYDIFSLNYTEYASTLLRIKSLLKYSILEEENFDGKECYKLTLVSGYGVVTTIYFEKENYFPVAYIDDQGNVYKTQVNVGVVEDSDVSADKIREKMIND